MSVRISPRINHVLRKRTCADGMIRKCDQNRVSMFGRQRCSSRTVGQSTIALESYFEELAQEVWERNLINVEMQTTLLNMYRPKLTATILKALRERLKESDQLHSGGDCRTSNWNPSRIWSNLKRRMKILGWRQRWVSARRSCVGCETRRNWVSTFWRCIQIVFMQKCKDAGKKSRWTDKSVDPTHKKIRSSLCAREYKTKKQCKIQRALPASHIVLCNATSRSGEGACLNHDAGEFVKKKKRKPLKLRNYDISRAHFQGTAQSRLYPTSRRRSSDIRRRQSWQIGPEHVWNSRCFSHLANWSCEIDLWRDRRIPERQTQCSIVPQTERRWEDGGARWRLCVFVRWWWIYISTVFSNLVHSERLGNTWIRTFRHEKPSVVESCVQSWSWSNWTVPGHWTWCETRSTPRQWIRMKRARQDSEFSMRKKKTRWTGVRRTRRPILNTDEATRYRSACGSLSYLAQADWTWLKRRNIGSRERANLVNSTSSRWKRRCDFLVSPHSGCFHHIVAQGVAARAVTPSTCHPWCHMFECAFVVSSCLSLSCFFLTSTFSLSLSTCSVLHNFYNE